MDLIKEDATPWRTVEAPGATDPRFHLHHIKILDFLSRKYEYEYELRILSDRRSGFNLELEGPGGRKFPIRRMINEVFRGGIRKGETPSFRLFGGDIKSSHISVWRVTPLPEKLRPVDVIELQIYTNLEPFDDGDKFDHAVFNSARFVGERVRQHAYWREITGPCLRIKTSAGVSSLGPIPVSETGYLEVEATEEIDPRSAAFGYGTPIRLINSMSGTELWSGELIEAKIVRDSKRTKIRTALKAVDVVGHLASITRYGAKDGPQVYTSKRLINLQSSAKKVSFVGNMPTGGLAKGTPWETSLLKHLDATLFGTGFHWRQKEFRQVEYVELAKIPDTELIISDAYMDGFNIPVLYHSHLSEGWSSSLQINEIEVTMHHAKIGPNGQVLDKEEQVSIYKRPGLYLDSGAWLGRRVKLDTVQFDIPSFDAEVQKIWQRNPEWRVADQVTIPIVANTMKPENVKRAIEVISGVTTLQGVSLQDSFRRQKSWTSRITHSIDPLSWTSTIGLIALGE